MDKTKIVNLNNGAILLYNKDKRNKYSAIKISFLCGSSKNIYNGTAHFLEHIIMKQTTLHSRDELIDLKTKLAPSLNAQTSQNILSLSFYRANYFFKDCIKLVGELLTKTDFNEEIIETEKGVVYEEYLRIKNKDKHDLFSKLTTLVFDKYITPENTLGNKEDLSIINKDILIDYKKQNFFTNNMIISYVGNFNLRKIKNILNKEIVSLFEYNENYLESKYKVIINKKPDMLVYKNEDDNIKILVAFPYDLPIKERYTSFFNRFLANHFQINKNSLFANLRKKGLVYTSTILNYFFDSKALFVINCTTSVEKINNVINEINFAIKEVLNNHFDEDELQQYKDNRLEHRDESIPFYTKVDKRESQLENYLRFDDKEMINPKPIKYYDRFCKNTTTKMIDEFAKKIFNKDNKPYVVIMGNVNDSDVPNYEEICNKIMHI